MKRAAIAIIMFTTTWSAAQTAPIAVPATIPAAPTTAPTTALSTAASAPQLPPQSTAQPPLQSAAPQSAIDTPQLQIEPPAQSTTQLATQPTTQPTTQPPLIEFPPPSTHPFLSSATRPSQQSAEDMLRQMLQPANQGAKPLIPVPNAAPPIDMTSGRGAIIPTATTQPLKPDGTLLNDRVARLTKTPDGKFLELTFDSDAYGNTDPPLLLLPNDKLSQLEDLVNNSYADLKLRVSGEITAYRGRNYLFLTRWSQVQDVSQPLK